ncbi:hypothetical protein HDV00_002451 [Rhizophlyctis rosea]|nr:hypothetical protein HDV00_002451 [Rhizophlyctis rosea]
MLKELLGKVGDDKVAATLLVLEFPLVLSMTFEKTKNVSKAALPVITLLIRITNPHTIRYCIIPLLLPNLNKDTLPHVEATTLRVFEIITVEHPVYLCAAIPDIFEDVVACLYRHHDDQKAPVTVSDEGKVGWVAKTTLEKIVHTITNPDITPIVSRISREPSMMMTIQLLLSAQSTVIGNSIGIILHVAKLIDNDVISQKVLRTVNPLLKQLAESHNDSTICDQARLAQHTVTRMCGNSSSTSRSNPTSYNDILDSIHARSAPDIITEPYLDLATGLGFALRPWVRWVIADQLAEEMIETYQLIPNPAEFSLIRIKFMFELDEKDGKQEHVFNVRRGRRYGLAFVPSGKKEELLFQCADARAVAADGRGVSTCWVSGFIPPYYMSSRVLKYASKEAGGMMEREEIKEVLKVFGFGADVYKMKVDEMDKTSRRRLGICVKLIRSKCADVIILDEVRNGLFGGQMDWVLRYIEDRSDAAFIIVSDKSPQFRADVCDVLFTVEEGELALFRGTAFEFTTAHPERFPINLGRNGHVHPDVLVQIARVEPSCRHLSHASLLDEEALRNVVSQYGGLRNLIGILNSALKTGKEMTPLVHTIVKIAGAKLLGAACLFGHDTVIKALVKFHKPEGDAEIADEAVRTFGWNVHSRVVLEGDEIRFSDYLLNTPWGFAAEGGHAASVKALVMAGVGLEFRALTAAINLTQEGMVDFLFQKANAEHFRERLLEWMETNRNIAYMKRVVMQYLAPAPNQSARLLKPEYMLHDDDSDGAWSGEEDASVGDKDDSSSDGTSDDEKDEAASERGVTAEKDAEGNGDTKGMANVEANVSPNEGKDAKANDGEEVSADAGQVVPEEGKKVTPVEGKNSAEKETTVVPGVAGTGAPVEGGSGGAGGVVWGEDDETGEGGVSASGGVKSSDSELGKGGNESATGKEEGKMATVVEDDLVNLVKKEEGSAEGREGREGGEGSVVVVDALSKKDAGAKNAETPTDAEGGEGLEEGEGSVIVGDDLPKKEVEEGQLGGEVLKSVGKDAVAGLTVMIHGIPRVEKALVKFKKDLKDTFVDKIAEKLVEKVGDEVAERVGGAFADTVAYVIVKRLAGVTK